MNNTRGTALVIALILSLVLTIIVAVGTQLMVTSFNNVKNQQHLSSEVDNVSRSGLVDAMAWFKRQPVQPVASGVPCTKFAWADGAFNPLYSTNTATSDTIAQNIGLVKQMQLSEDGLIWGRYEVWRQTNTTVAAYNPNAVHDVSGEKLFAGQQDGNGYVWDISSRGYIYTNRNPALPYNQAPNQVIATSLVSTELLRISLNTQVPCAFIVSNGGTTSNPTVIINQNGRIEGGTYGCGRASGKPPSIQSGGSVTGTLAASNSTSTMYNDPTVSYTLGVSTTQLKMLADYVVPNVASLPALLPNMALIYINGNAEFTINQPLVSSGILFVQGNLTFDEGSNSTFSGLIYVTGTATINDPTYISGCVIAYGGMTLSSASATDVAEIQYDSNILTMVSQQICQYREMKSTYRVSTGLSDMN
ncbi:MAG: hypothetical protein ABSH12_03545 [Endomicrobiales bacterium]|jgi:hypothetical protein